MTETARPTLSGLLEQFDTIGGPEEFGPEGFAIMVALWQRSNKLGWRRAWKMTNADLMQRTGISNRDTLNKYRKKLVEAGLIGYVPPPRGSSRGDYSVNFNLLAVGEVVENIDHFDGNIDEESPKVVKNFDHSGKVVENIDHFSDTVLKDLSSSSASSASAAAAEKPESYESFYAAHKRVFGFECNPFQANKLGVYIDQDGLDEAVIIRAIERAALAATGYRFNLITKILDDYFHSGVKTLEQAIAWDANFDAKKQTGSTRASPMQSKQQRELEELDHFIKEEQKSGQGRGRDISSYY